MNETLRIINERISIKEGFLEKPVPDGILEAILDLGVRAPNASNMQRYSIIVIKDKEMQKAIRAYPCSVALVFNVDLNRWIKMCDAIGETYPFAGVSHFLTGVVDAVLCAQNIAIAAQSLGIGSLFTNSIFRTDNMSEVFETLKLPKYVFPIITLCLGYPEEWPEKRRSRLKRKGIVHTETYHDFSKEDIKDIIDEYNSKDFVGVDSEKVKALGFKDYVEWIVKEQIRRSVGKSARTNLWNSLAKSGFLDPKYNGLDSE